MSPVKKSKPRRQYGKAKDGSPIVSVTTVIGQTLGWSKDGLMFWAAERSARKALELSATAMDTEEIVRLSKLAHVTERDNAADAGKTAHAMVEAYLKGEDPDDAVDVFLPADIITKARAAFAKFVAWWPTAGYEVILNEQAYVDVDAGYGGTMDLVLRNKATGETVVADNKTGKRIYDEVVIQLGAYALLARLHGHDVKSGLVIHIPVEGEASFVEVAGNVLEWGAKAFAALLLVHRSKSIIKLEQKVAA